MDEINVTSGCVTTSSCSGRLAVYLEGPARDAVAPDDASQRTPVDGENGMKHPSTSAGGKGGGKWLFTSHTQLDLEAFDQSGQILSLLGLEQTELLSFPRDDDNVQRAHLKFEPMILHILTSSMQQAQRVLTAATAAGFRESGISGLADTKGQATPPMVAVRSTGLAFDMTVGFLSEGKVLPMVSEKYLRHQLQWANRSFFLNEERTARFQQHFQTIASAVSTSPSNTEHAEQRPSRPLSEKQIRKQARKHATRESFEQHSKQIPEIHVCERPEFDDSPEMDVRVLLGEDPAYLPS